MAFLRYFTPQGWAVVFTFVACFIFGWLLALYTLAIRGL